MSRMAHLLLALGLLGAALGACGAPSDPCRAGQTVPTVVIIAPSDITAEEIEARGQVLNFTAESNPVEVTFEWALSGPGSLTDSTRRTARYAAPASVGVPEDVTIEVKIVDQQTTCVAVQRVNLRLLPSVAAVPTSAPTPRPTSIPDSTRTSTRPPAATAAPTPAAESPLGMNIRAGDRVAQSTTLVGELPADFAGDLWVFVAPPSGLLYPQSPDACAGAGTPRFGNRWELPVGFGGPGDEDLQFQIVLARADAAGSQALSATLRQWCQSKHYPGLDALPAGVTAIEPRVGVTRSNERSMRPLPIPQAEVPGQAAFSNLADQEVVPPQKILKGSYAGVADSHVWVLVYAVNGRWYPQSMNACAGVPAAMENGAWQVQAGFGGTANVGEPFDVVLVLADAGAHQFFDQTLRGWCRAQHFPGLLTLELPQGLAEQARVRVVRR